LSEYQQGRALVSDPLIHRSLGNSGPTRIHVLRTNCCSISKQHSPKWRLASLDSARNSRRAFTSRAFAGRYFTKLREKMYRKCVRNLREGNYGHNATLTRYLVLAYGRRNSKESSWQLAAPSSRRDVVEVRWFAEISATLDESGARYGAREWLQSARLDVLPPLEAAGPAYI
jgi:hypothetical protein